MIQYLHQALVGVVDITEDIQIDRLNWKNSTPSLTKGFT